MKKILLIIQLLLYPVCIGFGYLISQSTIHSAHLLYSKDRDFKVGDIYVIADIRYNKYGKIDTLQVKYVLPILPYITDDTDHFEGNFDTLHSQIP